MGKLRFVHPRTGQVFERTTNAAYTHISIKGGEAKWHSTAEAAQRRGGEVHPIGAGLPPKFNDRRPEVKSSGPATCTVTSGATGQKCGAPAVKSFKSRSGEDFHECQEHTL